MRISDWSSDVCSSDLTIESLARYRGFVRLPYVVEVTPPMGEAGSFPEALFAVRAGFVQLRISLVGVSLENAARVTKVVLHMLRLPVDRKSTRLTPVTNAHLVCRLLLEKKKKHHYSVVEQ